jgi:hypothetical protein
MRARISSRLQPNKLNVIQPSRTIQTPERTSPEMTAASAVELLWRLVIVSLKSERRAAGRVGDDESLKS